MKICGVEQEKNAIFIREDTRIYRNKVLKYDVESINRSQMDIKSKHV
jgi:hypothetical protein